MKIIFLDVDGELTYSDYENEETANIDMEKVKLLKKLCDQTEAKIVISSSWRGSINYTPKIYHTLIDILADNGIEVVDDAPYIPCEFEEQAPKNINMGTIPDLKLKYGTGRAAEIQKWLQEHETDNFVILDDENWCWSDYGYEKKWIQPTWFGNGGLQKEHIQQAIKILNEGE